MTTRNRIEVIKRCWMSHGRCGSPKNSKDLRSWNVIGGERRTAPHCPFLFFIFFFMKKVLYINFHTGTENPILILWLGHWRRNESLETWKVSYKMCWQATKSEASYTQKECNDVLLKITNWRRIRYLGIRSVWGRSIRYVRTVRSV